MPTSRPGLGPGIATSVGPAMLAASLWVGAWLRGQVGFDDTADALDRIAPDAAAAPLLPALRASGSNHTWLLMPRGGRTIGWPSGSPDAPGPAVLLGAGTAPVGLVRLGGPGWRLDPAPGAAIAPLQAAALPGRAAARALGDLLVHAAAGFERLGLERRPATASDDRWQRALRPAPPGLAADAAMVLLRAARVRDALDLARLDDGAAVTAGEAHARADALRRLADGIDDLLVEVVAGLNPARPA
jgi:hypothetical protein